MHRPEWLSRWSSDPGAQAGVLAAAWSVAGSFGRGLLPRSVTDQAVATAGIAAVNYQVTATTWGALMASAALPGQRPGPRATAVISGVAIAGGIVAETVLRPHSETSVVAAAGEAAGRRLAFVGMAGAAATVWDHVLHGRLGMRRGLDTTLLPNIATGATIAALTVLRRNQRARRYGIVAPDRHAVRRTGAAGVAQAGLVGVGTAGGLTLLTVGEQAVAGAIEAGLTRVVGRDVGAAGSFLAHAVTLSALLTAGSVVFGQVVVRSEARDDIIEPAYPEPPTSPHVSSGPASAMPFDSLGKEGRRFVLMALTPAEIGAVMGRPPLTTPVRVVGGYESAKDVAERARLTLADMDAVGAFDRGLIVVGAPTGVGYLNYSAAEAWEYLTLGDCATVVPQYSLVPSALALPRTGDGIRLTRLVLEGIRDRVAAMPADRRPRVVLFGESLGANVALDVACAPGAHVGVAELERLGVSGGIYLGVPFRTSLWRRWRDNPEAIDPHGRLLLVAQGDELPAAEAGVGRHAMVVHHDDPVNKFAYQMVVQQPWWLGPPATRPPLVPRETRFRPITSFVLALVDLKNGMQSRPGEFVRRGHDYRIELVQAVMRAYGLTAADPQVDAVEGALRLREQEWATRRLVARTFDAARRRVLATLEQWGQSASVDVADLDPAALVVKTPLAARLGTAGPGA